MDPALVRRDHGGAKTPGQTLEGAAHLAAGAYPVATFLVRHVTLAVVDEACEYHVMLTGLQNYEADLENHWPFLIADADSGLITRPVFDVWPLEAVALQEVQLLDGFVSEGLLGDIHSPSMYRFGARRNRALQVADHAALRCVTASGRVPA